MVGFLICLCITATFLNLRRVDSVVLLPLSPFCLGYRLHNLVPHNFVYEFKVKTIFEFSITSCISLWIVGENYNAAILSFSHVYDGLKL